MHAWPPQKVFIPVVFIIHINSIIGLQYLHYSFKNNLIHSVPAKAIWRAIGACSAHLNWRKASPLQKIKTELVLLQLKLR